MEDSNPVLLALEDGPSYSFHEWPNYRVPEVAAGVYTIWQGAQLVYVGMAGRSLTREHVIATRSEGAKRTGLFSRLGSHAGGRRSGDQFCVYVADRLVLPMLSSDEIAAISSGQRSFDSLVRTFIHANLLYRFVETESGVVAGALEMQVRRGVLRAGAPLLNPIKTSNAHHL
jgi:hypothetical protein